MLRQLEGSRAVAETVARCRPQVVAAYPISPQTHIVEALSDLVRTGELAPCEYLMVESEFGALSACIGASAAGARAYTATASQGLLFMAEALPNASGLGLPIVMTVANRAIGAPINIWNDHSDAMSQRDAGWLLLFASSNQEAVDLHVQAFALAERLSLPVMVCMDGFVLTHAVEEIDVPDQEQVDAFLPPFAPRQWLDPDDPVTIGAMVGPEAFTEVKYLMRAQQLRALDEIPRIADGVRGRRSAASSGGLVRPYRTDDAEVVVVAMGSVLGSLADVVDELRDEGVAVGALGVTCYRPWPLDEVRAGTAPALERVVVLNRAFAVGSGSILGQDVRLASAPADPVHDVVAGLGGRPVTRDVAPRPARRRARPAGWTRRAALPRPRPGTGRAELAPRARPHAHSANGVAAHDHDHRLKLYQVGTFAAGNRLLDPERADGPGRPGPGQLDHLGPPGVPRLRRGARRAVRARRRDAGDRRRAGHRQRDRVPRGVLHALPRVRVAGAVAALAVRQRRRRGLRGGRRAAGQGRERRPGGRRRPATAAPSTSASAACRACSSATTTCSSSATTTRAT